MGSGHRPTSSTARPGRRARQPCCSSSTWRGATRATDSAKELLIVAGHGGSASASRVVASPDTKSRSCRRWRRTGCGTSATTCCASSGRSPPRPSSRRSSGRSAGAARRLSSSARRSRSRATSRGRCSRSRLVSDAAAASTCSQATAQRAAAPSSLERAGCDRLAPGARCSAVWDAVPTRSFFIAAPLCLVGPLLATAGQHVPALVVLVGEGRPRRSGGRGSSAPFRRAGLVCTEAVPDEPDEAEDDQRPQKSAMPSIIGIIQPSRRACSTCRRGGDW